MIPSGVRWPFACNSNDLKLICDDVWKLIHLGLNTFSALSSVEVIGNLNSYFLHVLNFELDIFKTSKQAHFSERIANEVCCPWGSVSFGLVALGPLGRFVGHQRATDAHFCHSRLPWLVLQLPKPRFTEANWWTNSAPRERSRTHLGGPSGHRGSLVAFRYQI